MSFEEKYLKYKSKYFDLLKINQIGGAAGGAGVVWNGIGFPPPGRCIICGEIMRFDWIDLCSRAHYLKLEKLHADYEDGGVDIPDPRVVEYFRRYPVAVHRYVNPVRINTFNGYIDPNTVTSPIRPAVIGSHVMSSNGFYWGRIVGISEDNAFQLNNTRIIRRSQEGKDWQPVHFPAGVVINDVRPPLGPPPYPADPIFPAATIGDYVIYYAGEIFLGQISRRVGKGYVLQPIPYVLQPYTENVLWSAYHFPPGVTITDNRVAVAVAAAGGHAVVINPDDDFSIPEIVDKLREGNPEVGALIKEIQCPICLVNIKKILICPRGGHSLCSRCTIDLPVGSPCPLCRASIDATNFKVMHQKYLKY